MRVLTVHPGPSFSVADVLSGWTEAFGDLGCDVATYNLDDRLTFYSSAGALVDDKFRKAFTRDDAIRMAANGIKSACFEYQPDVLFIVSAFYIPASILDLARARGIKVVVVHTESPYEDDRQLLVAEHATLNVLNDPTNLDRFPAGSYYQPHSYRPSVHYRRTPGPDDLSDFCFVGTGYASRIDFLEQVDFDGVDVALAGNWQQLAEGSPLRKYLAHDIENCCDNTETVELYSGAKVSANLYRKESNRPDLSDGWACGPREIELAAIGTPFLRESRPESDLLFPMLPTFVDPADFSDILRWFLDHPVELQEAGRLAQAAVADRTFTQAARRLLAELDRL